MTDKLILLLPSAVPEVSDQRIVNIHEFNFYQLRDGEIVIVGWVIRPSKRRVTSSIVRADRAIRSVVTTSGRRYFLTGPAAVRSDENMMLTMYHHEQFKGAVDITADFMTEFSLTESESVQAHNATLS